MWGLWVRARAQLWMGERTTGKKGIGYRKEFASRKWCLPLNQNCWHQNGLKLLLQACPHPPHLCCLHLSNRDPTGWVSGCQEMSTGADATAFWGICLSQSQTTCHVCHSRKEQWQKEQLACGLSDIILFSPRSSLSWKCEEIFSFKESLEPHMLGIFTGKGNPNYFLGNHQDILCKHFNNTCLSCKNVVTYVMILNFKETLGGRQLVPSHFLRFIRGKKPNPVLFFL